MMMIIHFTIVQNIPSLTEYSDHVVVVIWLKTSNFWGCLLFYIVGLQQELAMEGRGRVPPSISHICTVRQTHAQREWMAGSMHGRHGRAALVLQWGLIPTKADARSKGMDGRQHAWQTWACWLGASMGSHPDKGTTVRYCSSLLFPRQDCTFRSSYL